MDLDSPISRRFGTSPYFIILDTETLAYEAIPNPGASSERGAGMQAVVIAASHEVQAVLTGYCSPTAAKHLEASGIEVFPNLQGTVREAIQQYMKNRQHEQYAVAVSPSISLDLLTNAFKNTLKQFANILPMLIGVVLLIGLFNALVSKESLANIFIGNTALDTLAGTILGSAFAGNPVNSYIIGNELLELDVSLYAVTAFLMAWVTVGLIQLPAEIAALGKRFALWRNGLSFIMTVPIAVLTVVVFNLIHG